MPFATTFAVGNGTPPDIQLLLNRLGELEKKLTRLEAENTHLKSELARKDKIVAGLQQRLFGSSSEKLDPDQLQFELDQLLLGKPAPPSDSSGETSAPEEGKSNAAKTRRTKADRFPKNLKILVENMIHPTKLGMKNWMFFGSVETGTNNALIYTLLAKCRARALDPEDYLVEVIKRLPPGTTPEQAAALTPARIAAERRAKAKAEQVA
jgi:hypothetical protein